ncbi:bifunctional folylpolyglutamate synthase/dihydrofolate synthase [Pediococcus ethanolidurans]|uniref:bifunctional folylpolyglutamate synthase/dihydrofolate synthase n=1 Tax=Pediococcus ethanolidurans TaxID=319653 RepID=UPI002954271D|nr:folylpolyglutamate synthase/dihydrofolate synthase family protein [Pediococcus ethanolidurans]MDV7718995.1 bifunctional folylpolyglutamate synthase/dihydrofolate synthase [Pediococcus ethanolidurans]
MTEDQQTYHDLIAKMNHQVLVTQNDRVPILRHILAQLQHPEQAYKVIHIAGTNGKGSTGAMLAAILQANGYHVGHFSSPAMLDDREQIKLDGQMISYTAFLRAYQVISDTLKQSDTAVSLSIFEWFTLIALVAFKQANVDYVVLEVGLGGKNDATNAISAPLLTLFTHIDYDHTQILGHTIRKIATQKAGIIKPGSTVIVAPHQKQMPRQVLRQVAENQQVNVHFVQDVHLKIIKRDETGTKLQISGPMIAQHVYQLGLVGNFQLDNLATVLSAVTWLQRHGTSIKEHIVHQALAQLSIPGRMQLIHQAPTIILDGAHNPDGAKQLVKSLKTLFPNRKISFLLGFLADKNYFEMLKSYLPLATDVYVNTPSQHQRALDKHQLAHVIQTEFHFPKDHLFELSNSKASLNLARQQSSKNDVIIVTGSFYFIKQFEGDLNV